MSNNKEKQALLDASALLARRKFLRAAGTVAVATVAVPALAESLADVPARRVGDSISGLSQRSKYVHLERITEATPGKLRVDPALAINSKTPLDKLVGAITPSDMHYERSHSGSPDLDPAQHRLLIHGMAKKELVFTMEELRAMPSVSRIHFMECSGNGWENWKKADPGMTVQDTHGLVSMHEWTGVHLSYLMEQVNADPASTWMLAEGGDAAGVARSIPLTDEIIEEALVVYAQNGEPLRPAHGFPIRLLIPGMEGNLSIKWLRRLKFGDRPFMTRWETARYTQLLPNGKARQFQLYQEVNSVITSPSGTMRIGAGYNRITGLAWSGRGKIAKVEISTDGGASWREARLNAPILHKAQVRFDADWHWDGRPTRILSRSTDDKGHVQPDRQSLLAVMGENALFHYNAQQTWAIDAEGRVTNALS
ncbi:sulfite dehydrogenase [Pseudomonas sp. PDM17]|uniref:sulfite dehydrogenase n=1 Tax=Pseudomonas sp. PDM17 TaxID=2769285 RepID=UPI001785E35B|nr:sulfite dehydrogenase [Pseudomonas sp. PDM17]MBD9504548.1 sulfite dehydrogenase [Pseudomonas sp. PDM17]